MSKDKPDAFDNLALTIAKDDPDKSNYAISQEINRLGAAPSQNAAYRKITRRDYLLADLDKVKSYNDNELHRDLRPLAGKLTKKALNDKELTHKEKFPYVNMVMKAAHNTDVPGSTITVPIEHIQVLIQQGMDSSK